MNSCNHAAVGILLESQKKHQINEIPKNYICDPEKNIHHWLLHRC